MSTIVRGDLKHHTKNIVFLSRGSKPIDKQDIQDLIDSEVEENLQLDYKAAGALDKTDGKKAEISKDVSAMANSAGGRIIYGVAEYNDANRKHFPEKIDAIDLKVFTKEWLEQVINSNISPKIPDLLITPVAVDTATGIFVVDIPQSVLGHQARDKRYYKRYNFQSVAMEDYELKDILNREVGPSLDVQFQLIYDYAMPSHAGAQPTQLCYLDCTIKNTGNVIANYVSVHAAIPSKFQHPKYAPAGVPFSYTNMVRDRVDRAGFGIARNSPILPELSHSQESQTIHRIMGQPYNCSDKIEVTWSIYADNATPKKGETSIVTAIEGSFRTSDHSRIGLRKLDEFDNALPPWQS